MQVTPLPLPSGSQSILETAGDCLWILYAGLTLDELFAHTHFQWLDWQLRTQMTRALTKHSGGNEVLFVPTSGRLNFPLVALWGGTELPVPFEANCSGQNWQKILVLDLTKNRSNDFFKKLSSLELDCLVERIEG